MRFYIPQLDGLRFFAFLAVFVSHASAAFDGLPARSVDRYHAEWWGRGALCAGSFGVELFFVLSSFLITSLLVREREARGRIDVPAFWMRRALRIWPLYLGVVALYALSGGLTAGGFAAFTGFVGNWGMAAWDIDAGLAAPLWSVSVEEQFYLVWPLILAAVPRRALRPVGVGLIVTAVAVRYALFASGSSAAAVWLNSFAHLDAIGVGALIAVSPRPALAPVVRGALAAGATLALVVCGAVVSLELLRPASPYIWVGRAGAATLTFLVIALACGALLVATLAGAAWLARPPFASLGRISYGLYVFHQLALWPVEGWSWPYRLPAAFVVTLAIAAVSYRYYEAPFLRLKGRFSYVCGPPGERSASGLSSTQPLLDSQWVDLRYLPDTVDSRGPKGK